MGRTRRTAGHERGATAGTVSPSRLSASVRALRTGVWVCARALVICGLLASSLAGPAQAAFRASSSVAIINGSGSADGGTLPESGTVAGSSQQDFGQFTFTDLTTSDIDPATLLRYDTVVLNQVFTTDLSQAQEQTLVHFVVAGGKVIIHDADGTTGTDYSWLPVPADTGTPCLNCGNTDGSITIIQSSPLVSSDPSSPNYVDVSELPGNTDAAGDANVLRASDPRWATAMRVSNDNNASGAVEAYASDGGEIIYNGLDTDSIGQAEPSGNDWLGKLYYQELALQWDPDNLPHTFPVAGGGGGPVANCGREALAVGVVGVCADSISGSGTDVQATGNVTLNGGISVGDGPIDINESTNQIASEGSAPIAVLRAAGPLSLGSTTFTIDGSGTTDPVSGTPNLAAVSLLSAKLSALASLTVGGLPFSLPQGDGVKLYLDAQNGGGLIGGASISLPLLKLAPSGSISLGLYATASQPVIPIGGKLHLGKVALGPGWSFNGLDLTYQAASDTWTASGGLTAPIGSFQASGSLLNGRLDSIGVSVGGQEVPLGDSGFFFTDFGGQVSGLAKGPLSLSASTAGFWGVPKAPVEPFYLDNVTVTVNFGGSVTLDGAASFILKDKSPVKGHLKLQIAVKPSFLATGSVSVDAKLPTISFKADAKAGFNSHHFTAEGTGSLHIDLLNGSGQEVLSDSGIGAAGKLCTPHIRLLPHYCQTMGFAATWHELDQLVHLHVGVLGDILGGDPEKLVTVQVAAANGAAIRVRPGRSLLVIEATSASGPPAIAISSPRRKLYRATSPSGRVIFGHQAQFNLTSITVVKPRRGVWHVRVLDPAAGPVTVRAGTTHPIHLVRVFHAGPRGSRRHPLRAAQVVTLRWAAAGLPRRVRISIYRSPRPNGLVRARPLQRHLRASGAYRIAAGHLRAGRNYFTLVATLKGVPFQRVSFAGPVWAPPKHRRR